MDIALPLFCSNSFPCPLLLQTHNHSQFKAFNFETYCCSARSIHIRSARTKRKLRPSFLDQINEKWSKKFPSERVQFPREEQKQRQQEYGQEDEEEEEEEIETWENSGDAEIDASASTSDDTVSFTLPNSLITAPWMHGTTSTRTDFNHESTDRENDNEFGHSEEDAVCSVADKAESLKKEVNFSDEFVGEATLLLVDETERLEKQVNYNVKFNEESFQLGAVSAELTKDKKIATAKHSNDVVSLHEKLLGGNGEYGNVEVSHDCNRTSIELPRERERGEEDWRTKNSNTELVERMLPEHELKRLRNVALRMFERIKVGAAGITQDLVDAIHKKWRLDEVVKLKFEGPLSCNMKRTHEILEMKTGGLIIWRSGSSVVLYRGMAHKFQCVQSHFKQNKAGEDPFSPSEEVMDNATREVRVKDFSGTTVSIMPDYAKHLKDLSQEEHTDFSEFNQLLDELGPRFKDWCGCEPLPVDADLLRAVDPGYKVPFRLLPYGVRRCLTKKEMTAFCRLAKTTPPHFALGRNRHLQGLAKAMVKLWERSALAKIAIKHGVQNTQNERMAEELKLLTGGTLLSRNKEYIVFYRGNDFLPPAIMEALKERRKLTYLKQDEEEQARHTALAFVESTAKTTKGPLVAGTLTETVAATSHWRNQLGHESVEKMLRDAALARRTSLVKHLENKLALANGKLKRAEKALGKILEHLEPARLPNDLETITDEERFLFRRIGLSMKPYLLLGRRGVYDGTIENMHLHWKYREVVKIIAREKKLSQVKHIAISLEAESGGVLVSVDRTTKGYAIVIYRGKNYKPPQAMRPTNLLSKRQALARSIELQRREALKHHILDLQERTELLKSELEEMQSDKKIDVEKNLVLNVE